jgi:hypothetical protein
MVDINFDCPQCGQNLDAPETMVGLFIECPACTRIIKIPTAVEAQKAKEAPQEAELRPAPLPPRGDDLGGEAEGEKGTTMRIQLPPDLGIPEKRKRQIIIKRTDHS